LERGGGTVHGHGHVQPDRIHHLARRTSPSWST
jgi:hypothetical protein